MKVLMLSCSFPLLPRLSHVCSTNHKEVFIAALKCSVQNNGIGKRYLHTPLPHEDTGLPSTAFYASLLRTCLSCKDLLGVRRVHGHLYENGFMNNRFLCNLLVDIYAKCGSLQDAIDVFEKISERNVFSWNAIISAYVHHGKYKDAISLFNQMQLKDVIADKFTFSTVLCACSSPEELLEGKFIHRCIVNKNLESDAYVGSALITMYGKCGSLKDALSVFLRTQQGNLISWNAMISAYVQNGQNVEALQLFRRMQQHSLKANKHTFVSIIDACANMTAVADGSFLHACVVDCGFATDVFVGTALINMYSKAGNIKAANEAFHKIQNRNAVSWTAMISAYAQNGYGQDAIQLYAQMQLDGWKPDKITFVSILSACRHAGLLCEGFHFFISICKDYLINVEMEHYGCVIDLLARVGKLDEADDIIENMLAEPMGMTWVTLLGGCKTHDNVFHGTDAFFEGEGSKTGT